VPGVRPVQRVHACVKACSAGAVCHEQQAKEIEIDAGSVILTPGFEEFQASLRGEFGHGRYATC